MSDGRLIKSLDQIIDEKEKGQGGRNKRGTGRGGREGGKTNSLKQTSNNRQTRKQTIHSQPAGRSGRPSSREVAGPTSQLAKLNKLQKDSCAVKFLLSSIMVGPLIGTGGNVINDLMTLTKTKITVSSRDKFYPGTENRVVYIVGDETAVLLAQSLIWEMIGQQTDAREGGDDNVPGWKPAVARRNPGMFDEVEVEGEITIPASCAGAVIGAGGENLKAIAAECDIAVVLNRKNEVGSTQERVVSMAGSTAGCMQCTALVLAAVRKEENNEYAVKGTDYSK